jgi:hypothetical protein
MSIHVVLMRGDHDAAVGALKGVLPNLRWIASYAVDGAWDAVDVVTFQPDEDPAAARAALEGAGIEAEWLPARPSDALRAPGGAPG